MATVNGTPRTYTDEELAIARRKLNEAAEWRRLNPGAYKIIERLACAESAHGRKFGGKFLAEVTRQKDIPLDSGRGSFKLSNNFTAVFARWIVLEHPDMAPLVRIRPCAFDVVMEASPKSYEAGQRDGTA